MQSLWRQNTTLPQFPTLSGNLKTQAIVIGGGLAGILTAYFLEQKKNQNRRSGGRTNRQRSKQQNHCKSNVSTQPALPPSHSGIRPDSGPYVRRCKSTCYWRL